MNNNNSPLDEQEENIDIRHLQPNTITQFQQLANWVKYFTIGLLTTLGGISLDNIGYWLITGEERLGGTYFIFITLVFTFIIVLTSILTKYKQNLELFIETNNVECLKEALLLKLFFFITVAFIQLILIFSVFFLFGE